MKKTFALRDLEKLSGIKAHTLRIWEKRYNILNPERTAGNKRIYSIDDLSKILSFSLLYISGFKISVLTGFSKPEISEHLVKINNPKIRQRKAVIDMVIYMYRLDTDNFVTELDNCFAEWPAEIVMTEIIHRFLSMTGLLWKGNRLTEEHFAVTAIRNKMIRAIEDLKHYETNKDLVLLFLPGKGQPDLLLLYTYYILRLTGFNVLYMGNDVSVKKLETVIDIKKPKHIFTCFNKESRMDIREVSRFMHEYIHKPVLVVAYDKLPGPGIHLPGMDNVHFVEDRQAIAFLRDAYK